MSLTTRSSKPIHVTERMYDPFDVFSSDALTPFGAMTPWSSRLSDQLTSPSMRHSMQQFSPILNADLIESDNAYHVHADLPGKTIILPHMVYVSFDNSVIGVNKEDLEVTFADNSMTMKAERKEIHETNSDTVS